MRQATRDGAKSRWTSLALAGAALLAGPPLARATCSVTPYADTNGGSGLLIKGDALPQAITLLDYQTSVAVYVDCNRDNDFDDPGDTNVILPQNFEVFDIQGGGKDFVAYQNQTPFVGARKSVLVTLGPATTAAPNQVLLYVHPYNDYSVASQSSLVFDVQGGTGPDVVSLAVGDLIDSLVVMRGDLGAGDDRFVFGANRTLTNATVDVDVALGSGNNQIYDYRNEIAGATAVTSFYSGSDGAASRDEMYVSASGPMDAAARRTVRVNLAGGPDRVKGDLYSETSGETRIRVAAGAGDDTFEMTGQDQSSVDGLLDLRLLGGPGKDTMLLDWVDFQGTGQYRPRLQGGDGNDLLAATFVAESSSTANIDLLLDGGAGTDVLFGVAVPGSGTSVPGPLLDGGSSPAGTTGLDPDRDLCIAVGLFFFRACEQMSPAPGIS